jgi:hypothetical protein
MHEIAMKRTYVACLFALSILSPKCDANGVEKTSGHAQDGSMNIEIDNAKKKIALSPLEGILNILVAKDGRTWSSFENDRDVRWTDVAPIKNFKARHEGDFYHRGGKLLLNGFGIVDMPNDKVGVDFGLTKDNEGNVSVIMSGAKDQVHSISLVKFYPSENYQEIIQRQLQVGDSVKLIADHCRLDEYGNRENAEKNKFYEIHIATGVIYAEASIDEGDVSTAGASSLGATMFDFYPNKPEQRIEKMRCHET